MPCTVEVTEYAETFIEEHVTSLRVYERIVDCMRLIGDYPQIGRTYDPEYEAARPPFPCRHLPVSDTPFTLYYTYNVETNVATVICIAFSAGDPMRRFMGMW